VFNHCVQDHQELAHAGHQSLLARFALAQEPMIASSQNLVAAASDQGGHI